MAKQTKTVHKKRGRPPGTNFGETIPARLDKQTLDLLDEYATKRDMSRSKAIRVLLALALIGEALHMDDEPIKPKKKGEKK